MICALIGIAGGSADTPDTKHGSRKQPEASRGCNLDLNHLRSEGVVPNSCRHHQVRALAPEGLSSGVSARNVRPNCDLIAPDLQVFQERRTLRSVRVITSNPRGRAQKPLSHQS